MTEPKTFASLGPTLLARKGAAKPAMRPQVPTFSGMNGVAAAQNLEDLGWNDMGEGHEEEERKGEVLPLTPASAEDLSDEWTDFEDEESEQEEAAYAEPEVLKQRTQIERSFTAPQPAPIAYEAPPPRRKAASRGRRAAFTLRLDDTRHLKLRLASTVKNCSAQQLVTEALDRFLADMPELDTLAAQVKRG